MADLFDEREEELTALASIFPEISIKGSNYASIDLAVAPKSPFVIRFLPNQPVSDNGTDQDTAAASIEHDHLFSHLPALRLEINLPDGYPGDKPPTVHLSTDLDWLPVTKILELEKLIVELWEDSGHCQIIYTYIDRLQSSADSGFELDQSATGCLTLPNTLEQALLDFNKAGKLAAFNANTYDCGICLEPKSGESCYQLERCGHIFCRQCLHDFYNNAIQEGTVTAVKCPDTTCGKDLPGPRARKIRRPLHPRELLAMGMEEPTVRRYVEMKRKKRQESDKTTVYCPREHCKHAARNPKFPPIPADLNDYPESDSDTEESQGPQASAAADTASNASGDDGIDERLAVCENPKCTYAFCRICYKSWHGAYARCRPRDPNELSAEDKASYDFIANHTTPCPMCASPVQKNEGCNHMMCAQCSGHFCYLCGGWLSPGEPYRHFNTEGTQCYQKLFDVQPAARPHHHPANPIMDELEDLMAEMMEDGHVLPN